MAVCPCQLSHAKKGVRGSIRKANGLLGTGSAPSAPALHYGQKGGVWMGGSVEGRLKACIHCREVYAGGFYAMTKTTSVICWATGVEGGMYLNSVRGPLFSIVSSYWGALVCACREQEALLQSPLHSMLSFMSGRIAGSRVRQG